ncbi:MAG TPA: peroxiredoxin [Ktedonobacterales bacterium]|nr:peroxiredoxin [Ktedonobacterales bacterium]
MADTSDPVNQGDKGAGDGRRVAIGDRAPDFMLPDQTGKSVRLSDLLSEQAVVLYFYPKDETQGCTAEACSFRDSYEVFKEAGAEVVGVSSDSVESHESFAAHHRLPFILLSDEGSALRKLYGVPTTMGMFPGRVTYIIDRDGIVRHIFSSQLQFNRHVIEALDTIQGMRQ